MLLPKRCENYIEKYFNEFLGKEAMCVRFQDTGDTFQGRGKGVVLKKNPSDFIINLKGGEIFYAEVKSTIDPRGVKSSLFSEQKMRRDRILALGCRYVYFIYSQKTETWYEVPAQIIQKAPNMKWEDMETFKNHNLTKGFKK